MADVVKTVLAPVSAIVLLMVTGIVVLRIMAGVVKTVFILTCTIVILIIIVFVFLRIAEIYDTTKLIEHAEKKCQQYTKYACKHPIQRNDPFQDISSPIIGGKYAMEGQFPHMVFAQIRNNDGRWVKCGGSLISENFVMTAAHCVNNTSPENIVLKLGSVFDMSKYDADNELFTVSKIYVHPDYDNKQIFNDIALLKLNFEVEFTPCMRPICLNTIFKDDFSNITGSGWGRLSINLHNASSSPRLMFVDMYINDEKVQSACIEQFGKERVKAGICAGHPTQLRSEASGDSGGPLQAHLTVECPYVYEQIGIVSYGHKHRELFDLWPVMYTRVADYIPWIVKIVWSHEL